MGRPGGGATRQPGNGLTACLLCSTRNTSATRSMVDSFILANSWRRQKWKKAEQSICEAGAGGGAGRIALMREVRFHTPGPGSEARVSFFLRRQDFISFRDRLSLRGSIQSSPEFICRTDRKTQPNAKYPRPRGPCLCPHRRPTSGVRPSSRCAPPSLAPPCSPPCALPVRSWFARCS